MRVRIWMVLLALGGAPLTQAAFFSAGWDGLQPVHEFVDAANFKAPRVKVLPSGHTLVVWGIGHTLWVNSVDLDTGTWNKEENINAPGGLVYSYDLQVDGAGNVLLVWSSEDEVSESYDIYYRWFDPATGWGPQQVLASTGSSFGDVAIAMNEKGEALVVWAAWVETDGRITARDVFASRFDPAQRDSATWGWSEPVRIEDSAEPAFYCKVALNARGDALVAWQSFETGVSRYNVWGTSYSSGLKRWQPSAFRLEAGDGSVAGSDGNPVVSIDAAGNGAALWVQQDVLATSAPLSLRANRFQGGRWSDAAGLVENASGHVFLPRLAMSSRGTTMAIWNQTEIVMVDGFPRGQGRVFCSSLDSATGSWSSPPELLSSSAEAATLIGVDMDAVGGGMIAWTQGGPDELQMWFRRFVDGSWGVAQVSDVSVIRMNSDLAVSPSGAQAQAVFRVRTQDASGHSTEHVSTTRFRSSVRRTFQNGLAGYTGGADAWIDGAAASTNHGASSTLKLDGAPDRALLLRFNLSEVPPASTVSAVELRLTATDASSASFDVKEVKKPWSERQVTWRRFARSSTGASLPWQKPGATGPEDVGALLGALRPRTLGAAKASLNGDGVNLVQAWVGLRASNLGFIVQNYADAAGDAAAFRSRETAAASERPALVLTYVVP